MSEEIKKQTSVFEKIENLKEIWFFLLKKWIIICIFGFGFATVGLFVSIFGRTKYLSKLTFVLDSSGMPSVGGLAGLAGSMGFGGATGESVFEGDNLNELLISKKMIELTLLEKIPNTKKTFADEYMREYKIKESFDEILLKENINFPINSDRKKFTFHQDSILSEIYRAFSEEIITVKNTSTKVAITNIRCKSLSKYISRYFPEKLIEGVSKFYTETKTKKSKINYDILRVQTDSIRIELYNSISGLAAANDDIFGLSPAYNVKRVPSAKRQVDIQANTAILTELVKNLEMARVNLLNTTPLIQVIDNPNYPLEEKRLRKLHGIIIGGFLGGILIVSLLLLKRKINLSTIKNQINE